MDEHSPNYYQNLFRLVSLLLSEEDKDVLVEMIMDFRAKFLNSEDVLPTFFDLEYSFYNMKVGGRKFIKVRTSKGFIRIYYTDIARELNEMQSWCFEKLFEVQKSIRFSNVNANIV